MLQPESERQLAATPQEIMMDWYEALFIMSRPEWIMIEPVGWAMVLDRFHLHHLLQSVSLL